MINMKKNKKIIILTSLSVILTISIVSIIILVIMQSNNTLNNNELINYWTLYRQNITNNNEIIYSLDSNDITLNIKNSYIEICYNEDNNRKCNNVKYTYDNNTLTILEDNQQLQGNYNVYFEDNTMLLEKIENKEKNVIIKNYFQKAQG